MERNKQGLVAAAVAGVIVLAVLSSFVVTFLAAQTEEIVLPDIAAQESPASGDEELPEEKDYLQVAVTPETVQAVVATLARPNSYYRELTLDTVWGDGAEDSATAQVQVWVDGSYTRTCTQLPDGTIQYAMVGEGRLYLWYQGDDTWFERPASAGMADQIARIPTYEDLLAAQTEDIISTGFEEKNGADCVYAEVRQEVPGYCERYWVEVNSGLLVAAETVKEDRVVLRMTAVTTEQPVRAVEFSLPDGTVLFGGEAG